MRKVSDMLWASNKDKESGSVGEGLLMPIVTKCPTTECGQTVRVRDDFAARRCGASKCHEAIPIPGGSAPQPARKQPASSTPGPAKTSPAKPAVEAAKPKPTDDFGYEDEAPVRISVKFAKDDDHDDDDRPAAKRNKDRDEDEEGEDEE